jgi:3-oxoacyl-[acyl-carrier protein] reductase
MDLGLKEKVALVTGASAGLGYAAAHALAAEGARLVICSRDPDRIKAAADRIRTDTGNEPFPTACDVSEADAVRQLVERTGEQFERIDILVSNAGGPPGGHFADLQPEQWERAFNLTLMSTLNLCRGVLPLMEAQRNGVILVITSLSAKQPIPGLVTSNTFRPGLTGLIKSIADEYGIRGIRANTVAPGYTRTERLGELAVAIADREGIAIEDVYSRWETLASLGRLGLPEEIGAAVAFLASERASFITGQHLAVDGGAIRGTMG